MYFLDPSYNKLWKSAHGAVFYIITADKSGIIYIYWSIVENTTIVNQDTAVYEFIEKYKI